MVTLMTSSLEVGETEIAETVSEIQDVEILVSHWKLVWFLASYDISSAELMRSYTLNHATDQSIDILLFHAIHYYIKPATYSFNHPT